MSSSKQILITGGAGFIGSNLALKLLERGHEITILDNLTDQIHGSDPDKESPLYNSIKGKCKFVRGDIRNEEDWKEAISGIEIIVHLAAETGTGQSMYNIRHYTDVNVSGTALMLDILSQNKRKVERVVLSSSRAIYGEGKYHSEKYGIVYPQQRRHEQLEKGIFEPKYLDDENLMLMPTDEESKLSPSSIYGINKLNQEQLLICGCDAIGIDYVSLRYQNVYGPGQSLQNPYTGILSIFSTLIKNQKQINIFEDGLESRDFVYIDDVVDATILGIEHPKAANQYLNIGLGKNTDVKTVTELLLKHYQSSVGYIISGNYRVGDIRHNFADISKASNIIGYKPKYSIEEGLIKFVDWVNTQSISGSSFEKTMDEMKARGVLKS